MQIAQNVLLNGTDNNNSFCYSVIWKRVALYSIIKPGFGFTLLNYLIAFTDFKSIFLVYGCPPVTLQTCQRTSL